MIVATSCHAVWTVDMQVVVRYDEVDALSKLRTYASVRLAVCLMVFLYQRNSQPFFTSRPL